MLRAVIFDLGGVVFPSPFEAYDLDAGLAPGGVRGSKPKQPPRDFSSTRPS
jgi:hypothetical protein